MSLQRASIHFQQHTDESFALKAFYYRLPEYSSQSPDEFAREQ
jgi:hypothetical protein